MNSKLSYKGIALARRNFTPITKAIYRAVIDVIMQSGGKDTGQALWVLNRELTKHVNGEFPMEDYTASVRIGAHYENPNLFQPKLVKRVAARGDEPLRSGDRAQYVVLKPTPQTPETSDRYEVYSYAKAHGLELDRFYYLHNQIKNPLLEIFSVMGPALERTAKATFDRHERKLLAVSTRAKLGVHSIDSYFSATN